MLRMKSFWLMTVLSAIALGCDVDEEHVVIPPVVIQFQTGTMEIIEGAAETPVRILFNSAVSKAAEISVKIDQPSAVVTNPASSGGLLKLQVAKGATDATFTIRKADNENDEQDRTVRISVETVSLPFTKGTVEAITVLLKDNDEPGPVQSIANFVQTQVSISENDQAGVEYQIHLSEPAAETGMMTIEVTSEKAVYGRHYIVEPALTAGKLTLEFSKGQEVASFRVRSVPNNETTGQLSIGLNIAETTGTIVKGENVQQVLQILDDELQGRAKGYQLSNGVDSYNVRYDYDELGRIYKRHWVAYTPYQTSGTETYFYDANNRIVKINKYAGRDVHYRWEGDRLVKAEDIHEGVVKSYYLFDYDEAGNIGGTAAYHLQTNGEYAAGFVTIYLYFTDGNIYKTLIYQPVDGEEEPSLVSTRTYENYIDTPNQFPMVEIVPTISAQKTLATKFTREESGVTVVYNITYEFDNNGKATRRVSTAGGARETVVYEYY